MRRVNYIPEIRAEFLLNYLYPEVGDQWIVQNEGTFYRNYNSDLLSIDNDKTLAQTARDSFIKLLPQGLITLDTDLKGEDTSEKFKRLQIKLRLLRETFKPIDTFRFRDSIFIEKQVDRLLQDKLSYVLTTYFGITLDQIENRYVRRYEIIIPGLSPEEYLDMTAELKPLKEFIEEWFIPVEVWCKIDIKEHNFHQQTNTRLTLGYNTEI